MKGSATVSEGRQGRHGVTLPDNNGEQDKLKAVSQGDAKKAKLAAQKKIDGTVRWTEACTWVPDEQIRDEPVCRAFETLHRHDPVSYNSTL